MDRLERLKELPTIEEWIEKLRIQKYESTERINPFHVFIGELEAFKKDKTYPRARDLWLRFYLYCEPPPLEVELAFLGRIVSDATTWKSPKTKNADFGLLGKELKKAELQRFDEQVSEVHKSLLIKGRKAQTGDVFDAIAFDRNEDGAEKKQQGRL